ncbi:MAG: hypothetical protein JWN70_2640, partial [Planctomycetaceae bacterium]|nr:hypothetical protein [Planctomycetaceae bacterium]
MHFSIGPFGKTIILGLLVLAGCGGDDVKPFNNLVPVSGTVSFDGKPVPQGSVSFTPVDPTGQAASSKITNGSFKMLTTVSAPGVIAGKYKVRIESKELPPEGAAAAPPPTGAVKPVKSLIPAKYGDVNTSGLEVDVVKGMPAIKWDLKP